MPHPAIHKDESNHQEQVGELIKQTTVSIDNLALKMLFVTLQQNNLDICIKCAVNSQLDFLVIYSCCHLSSTLVISLSQAIQWYCFL